MMRVNIAEGVIGRIDKVLSDIMVEHSRGKVQSMIKGGFVSVNSIPITECDATIGGGDIVTVELGNNLPAQTQCIKPEPVEVNIIYEDDDIAVIDKSPGLTVHPGAGVSNGTLVHGLVNIYGNNLSCIDTVRPGIVHRLDRWTSGLLLIAKNDNVHRIMSGMIKAREISRVYYALVYGQPSRQQGIIDAPIGRSKFDRCKMAVTNGGKDSMTEYQVLLSVKGMSLVRCKLQTGRTHQIRVHMKHIGCPIVGDSVYASRINISAKSIGDRLDVVRNMKRQALHAQELSFLHPISAKQCEYYSAFPQDISCLIEEIFGINPRDVSGLLR